MTLGGVYRILHQIGSGGGGGVYRGEDIGLRRPVAVKVLNPELARDDELVERFRNEAAILASLRHTNLVQVHAFGVESSFAYFVMELVEGESLWDAIVRCKREGRWMSSARVASIAQHIGSALATLHRSGIIHRDVKPANILLDPFRHRSVLVDVGVATRPGERTGFAGTPGYMAPELLGSDPLGPAADVFGFAVTLYELLTLRLPWKETSQPLSMLRVQREQRPRPPSTVRAELAAIDEVMLRALDAKPENRWQDVMQFAWQMARMLDEVATLAGEEGEASRPGAPGAEPASDSHPGWNATSDTVRPSSRGVVFRCVSLVVGARNAVKWRIELGRRSQHLADALSPASPPLGWLPTAWLVELLDSDPPTKRGTAQLGRDLGRAVVRATFRRFFPASSVTLSPKTTLQALPQIWPHYHNWGGWHMVRVDDDGAEVRITNTPGAESVSASIAGMLEALVTLSGGTDVAVEETRCEARGDDACVYQCNWAWSAVASRPQ